MVLLETMNSNKNDIKPKFRKIAELSSLGLMLPSSIAIGLFFGYWLDKVLHTQPWMLLIFLFFGIASGLISLMKGINKYKDDQYVNDNTSNIQQGKK